MIKKTKTFGVEITFDDGNPETADIVEKGDGYEEQNTKDYIEWMKKQLRKFGYKFINKDGEVEI